jgi:NAD(P)-dependent dehydrogenase (short-subunit alcohol dehydrogenase family)
VLHHQRFSELLQPGSGEALVETMIAVDLCGRTAALRGEDGALHRAIRVDLEANGAVLSGERPGQLDLFIVLASGGDSPDLIERLCRDAADRMVGGGRIVIIASAAGIVALRKEARASATAAAILALTRALALEFGERRIIVNAVAVGALEDGRGEELISHVPLVRAGRMDEVAQAVLFLCDPENSYMTGHVLLVEGGWAAGYARSF